MDETVAKQPNADMWKPYLGELYLPEINSRSDAAPSSRTYCDQRTYAGHAADIIKRAMIAVQSG